MLPTGLAIFSMIENCLEVLRHEIHRQDELLLAGISLTGGGRIIPIDEAGSYLH